MSEVFGFSYSDQANIGIMYLNRQLSPSYNYLRGYSYNL